jgi:predicted nucleic acid-binding protein
MKRKTRVYLDTSVISALFDERNPERKSLTELFFEETEKFEIYISEITTVEIARTPDLDLQNKMRKMIATFSMLTVTDDVEWLAKEYVHYGAVPGNYLEDALHIAIAVLNDLDYLLSWNFKHIVRIKTKTVVRMVNTLNNLRQIEILTPAELL